MNLTALLSAIALVESHNDPSKIGTDEIFREMEKEFAEDIANISGDDPNP